MNSEMFYLAVLPGKWRAKLNAAHDAAVRCIARESGAGHQGRTVPLLNVKKLKGKPLLNFRKNLIRIISFKVFLSSKLLLPYFTE